MSLKVSIWIGFFFNDTATTEIYTLSLHDALPICAALEDVHQRVSLVEQEPARVAQQERVRGVHHVRRGEPVMHEARGLAYVLGEGGGEGDNVVVGRLLYLAYALDRERGARAYLLDGLARYRPHLRVDFADGQLHVEPLLKLVALRPERAHLGQRVSFYHLASSREFLGTRQRPAECAVNCLLEPVLRAVVPERVIPRELRRPEPLPPLAPAFQIAGGDGARVPVYRAVERVRNARPLLAHLFRVGRFP